MAKDLLLKLPNLAAISDACLERGLSKREGDTNYFGVVATDGSAHRVIACSSGLQYIVQRCYQCIRGDEWRALGYLTSRESLIAFYERSGRLSEANKPALLGLPEKPEQAWRMITDALVSGAEPPFPAGNTSR